MIGKSLCSVAHIHFQCASCYVCICTGKDFIKVWMAYDADRCFVLSKPDDKVLPVRHDILLLGHGQLQAPRPAAASCSATCIS
jgi:hypothetical protein